jgi:hypothetical protein
LEKIIKDSMVEELSSSEFMFETSFGMKRAYNKPG